MRIENDQPGVIVKDSITGIFRTLSNIKDGGFFLQKQLTANFAKSYLLDDGQSSEYACLWIINIPKLPQIKMRGK